MRKFKSGREFQNKTHFSTQNLNVHHHAIIHVMLNESVGISSDDESRSYNGGDRAHSGRPAADRLTIPYRLSGVDLLPDIGRIPFRPVPTTNPDTGVIYKGRSASSNGTCIAQNLPHLLATLLNILHYLSTIAMCSPLLYSQPNKWYLDTSLLTWKKSVTRVLFPFANCRLDGKNFELISCAASSLCPLPAEMPFKSYLKINFWWRMKKPSECSGECKWINSSPWRLKYSRSQVQGAVFTSVLNSFQIWF